MKGKDLKDYWESDLGVSYIPWTKLRPDIDIELLEDGGMIDEDTMPAWMKAKVADLNAKTTGDKSSLNDEMKNALLGTPNIDTTQPPPVPPSAAAAVAASGGGLLQPPPPPLTLPLVNPFQLNNSILGMNLPPGMMPNVPIGVPPPNLPHTAAAAATIMMGLNSPFSQGPPPNLLQSMQMPDNKNTPDQTLSEQLLSMTGQPFVMPPSQQLLEDNMDVEMEDANKPPDSMVFSGGDDHHQNFDGPPRNRRDGNSRERSRRSSRSRDRDRGRDRDRNQHRNSRDRGKDGGRKDRWSDNRDNNNRRGDRDDRRERSEKSVNDRLWEMAEGYSSRDRPRDLTSEVVPQPLLEKPEFVPPPPPQHDMNYDPMEPEFDDRFRRGGPPPDDFEPPPHHLPHNMPPHHQHDGFNPDIADFERPPRMQHHDEFEPHERFSRNRDRRGDGFVEDRRMMDDFDNRGPMRGGPGPGPGPDFFPPREPFGPPPRGGPMMRGPGPGPGPIDGFQPRGPRGPGPRMFHPRGPLLRGPRPGICFIHFF